MAYTNTPLAVDPYSRFMVDVFDEKQIIGVPTGFQAFFGRPETGARTLFSPDSNVVDIDIMRGNEKIAALIHRGTNSRPIGTAQKNTNTQKYTSFSRLFPLGEEEGDINANQLLYRVAGENPYQKMTRLDRMRVISKEHHNEHIRRFIRLFEVLAASSVITGQHVAISGTTNTDLIYDFRRNSSNTVTVSTGWNQVGATILSDVDDGCDQIRASAHVNPDMIIIGGNAMDAFINNTDVQTQADNRRFELIEVGVGNPVPQKFMRFVDAGFTPRGRLRTPKGYELWMFTYTDIYETDAGTATKYMPEDKAVISYSGARCDRYFGPPERLPLSGSDIQMYTEYFGFNPLAAPMPPNVKDMSRAINPAMFYFDAYKSGDKKKITIRTQAAPIYATTQTDAFYTLEGLVT